MSKILLALLLGLLPGWAFGVELIHTTATLSEARKDLAATSVGNLALFAGGHGDSGYSDVVDIYDAETGTWSTTNLSQPRSNLAATTVGHLAIFAGGISDFGVSDVVDIYNAETRTWSVDVLSRPRKNVAATSVGNLALFGGGRTASGGSDVVDIHDAHDGTWSAAALSREGGIVATTVGAKAIFAWGNVADIFDQQANEWSVDAIANGLIWECAASVQNKGLFAGWNTLYVYDNLLETWSTDPRFHSWRGMAATGKGGYAFFAGGIQEKEPEPDGTYIGGADLDRVRAYWGESVPPADESKGDYSGDGFVGGDDLDFVRSYWGATYPATRFFDVLEIYDEIEDNWQVEKLSRKRAWLAATIAGNKILFAGGQCQDGYSNVVDIHALPTDVQRVVPEPSTFGLLAVGALTVLSLFKHYGD